MKRRQFAGSIGASTLLGAFGTLGLVSGCASSATGKGPKVVVVGGGFGGATAAKYVRMWSDYGIQVSLVEPNAVFVSCPISNLVIGGVKTMADITSPYDGLVKQHGRTPDAEVLAEAGGGHHLRRSVPARGDDPPRPGRVISHGRGIHRFALSRGPGHRRICRPTPQAMSRRSRSPSPVNWTCTRFDPRTSRSCSPPTFRPASPAA